MMLATMGHNSAVFNQTLSELAGAIDGKTTKRRFPYFKFYPRDWLEATRAMSLEERGAYIDFICLFMESEGDLADDDNWIRHQMHVPKQRWRKMKSSLIGHGKISVRGGRLVNDRCLRELDELMAKSTQNSKNIQKRWKKAEENSELCSKKVETFLPEKYEKTNEINDGIDTNVSRHARVTTDSDTDLERKKESPNGLLSSGDGQSDPPADVPKTITKAMKLVWEMYNETARRCDLSEAKILNTKRATALKQRLKEAGGGQAGVDTAAQALANLEKSAFCMGQNDRGWKANFDYFVSPKGFVKLYEGGHGNGAHAMAQLKPQGMSDAIWKRIQDDERKAKENGGISLW